MQVDPRRMNIRAVIIAWIVISLVLMAIFAFVIAPNLANWGTIPQPASNTIDDVYATLFELTIIAIPVWVFVVLFAGYNVFKYRLRTALPEGDGPPMHGNSRIQGIWLIVSIIMVTAVYVYGVYLLSATTTEAQGSNRLNVKVTGEQWLFDYTYPQYGNISGNVLLLVKGRPTVFTVTSIDVQHSFWIPDMAIKQDAVPGEYVNVTVTPNRTGTFIVRCAELCGLYHAYMNNPVKVVTESQFDACMASQTAYDGCISATSGSGLFSRASGSSAPSSAVARADALYQRPSNRREG